MKKALRITLDVGAYILLLIIYYTLRLVKAPFPFIPIESYTEWSMTPTLLTTDLMLFVVIMTLGGLWLFIGLWWLLYGFLTLVGMMLGASAFIWLRKKIKNRKNK